MGAGMPIGLCGGGAAAVPDYSASGGRIRLTGHAPSPTVGVAGVRGRFLRAVVFVIVAAIAALVALLVWLALGAPRPGGAIDPIAESALGTASDEIAVDSVARLQAASLEEQILRLEEQVAALNDEVLALRVEMQRLAAIGDTAAVYDPHGVEGELPESLGPGIDDYAGLVLIPARRELNPGLTVASPDFLTEFLGRPRERLSDRCEPMENPRLKEMLRLEEVGPIRVRMLEPAIVSLRRVFDKVKEMDADLYERIDTAGSLCVRQIRGTQNRASSHSFGLAVDINIDGHLDTFADGKTQLGLLLMSDLFHAEGWVWGAGWGREDSMHFEVSREKLVEWRDEARI